MNPLRSSAVLFPDRFPWTTVSCVVFVPKSHQRGRGSRPPKEAGSVTSNWSIALAGRPLVLRSTCACAGAGVLPASVRGSSSAHACSRPLPHRRLPSPSPLTYGAGSGLLARKPPGRTRRPAHCDVHCHGRVTKRQQGGLKWNCEPRSQRKRNSNPGMHSLAV